MSTIRGADDSSTPELAKNDDSFLIFKKILAREEHVMGKSRSFIYYPRLITMDTAAVHFSRRATAGAANQKEGLGTWVLIILMIYCGRKSSMSVEVHVRVKRLVRKKKSSFVLPG